ncbi:hypothetical protein FBQ87_06830 [Sphingobacteriales bacterium CHB3]|nr:hypothetical protein [Sphingobacteriales bacterium CHB3]
MEAHHEKVFRYKLDFYYVSALIYLLTLVAYGGIRGSFVEKEFRYVMNDPILYIIIFFVLMSIGSLILNYIRNRRVVVAENSITFKNRFHERVLHTKEIEWMHIGRERFVQTSGRFQVVLIKLKGRRRAIRIRIGRYEKEKELIHEMERIAQHVPKRKRPRWSKPRFTDR